MTTHDLPTAAGWLVDEHVRVRHELEQLGHSLEEEQARVADDRERLLSMLRAEGLLQPGGDVVLAMHRALLASPCRIVLASYGDAVGDLRQPNLPGTVDQYPNWRLPVADGSGRPLGLEELLGPRRCAQAHRPAAAGRADRRSVPLPAVALGGRAQQLDEQMREPVRRVFTVGLTSVVLFLLTAGPALGGRPGRPQGGR